MIPRIDAAALIDPSQAGHATARAQAAEAAMGVGFMTVHNTTVPTQMVETVIETYRGFFHRPVEEKQPYDMAKTGSNRGWGAPGSEQVDPDANPDYKQVFDCGLELAPDDPTHDLGLACYAPNVWPDYPPHFASNLQIYYAAATTFSLNLLCAIAGAVGEDESYFREKFSRPMALLRGNFYPQRPAWAGDKDFGIATHTDYGCLTLLATYSGAITRPICTCKKVRDWRYRRGRGQTLLRDHQEDRRVRTNRACCGTGCCRCLEGRQLHRLVP